MQDVLLAIPKFKIYFPYKNDMKNLLSWYINDASSMFNAKILDELLSERFGLASNVSFVSTTGQCNHCTTQLVVKHFILNSFNLENRLNVC